MLVEKALEAQRGSSCRVGVGGGGGPAESRRICRRELWEVMLQKKEGQKTGGLQRQVRSLESV